MPETNKNYAVMLASYHLTIALFSFVFQLDTGTYFGGDLKYIRKIHAMIMVFLMSKLLKIKCYKTLHLKYSVFDQKINEPLGCICRRSLKIIST